MTSSFLFLFNFLFLFSPQQQAIPASIYDFKVDALDGSTIDMGACKGKKILIVNTTAANGYTYRYAELEELSKKYKDKLVIIGFPVDDFGQEPGSNRQLEYFREKHYDVTFPLAAKSSVRGQTMAPVYQWLTQKKYNKLKDTEVKWDFQRYLINEKGELVAVFDPKVKTNDPAIIAAIEQ